MGTRGDSVHGSDAGSDAGTDARFALVASRYNPSVVDGLLAGARTALAEAGVPDDHVTVFRVPGAFEIPQAARQLAATHTYDAVVCLGCLIKGDTMHFEYLASASALGIMEVAAASDVPLTFGVLTTLTEAQALERSAPGTGNKGREAALAALEMVSLFRRLRKAMVS